MARHADVVLPASMTLERNDIGGSPNDACLIAMRQAVPPWGEARSDFAIFADLAASLGVARRFTEGRDEMAWLRHLYDGWRARVIADGASVPPFDEFWAAGFLDVPGADDDLVLFKQFRADPEGAPLGTPSGRIEIFSATIDGFGYADCPGHPTWLEPTEWLGAPLAGRFPLHLVANNPTARLHSQLDVGAVSQATKVQGREPIRIHPADAATRGVRMATWCACGTTAGAVSPAPW
jgi:biotin/methionine sulfoxide reductase